MNIRPSKISREATPGGLGGFGARSQVKDFGPFGVFIEWMDSNDGKKDGNEYWYGTNEKKTKVVFTNEEEK